MRKNAPFVDTYRTKCSVLGTMRALVSTVFATPVAMLIIAFGLSGNAASVFAPKLAQNESIAVNTEVVLAVDVSASMTPDEQALQREGYVQALSSREFIQALKASGNGRISITYFEWANVSDQKIILPWRLIDGPEAAGAVAAELARAPYRRSSRTSISGGLIFAQSLFESSPYRGMRRVIDVSGDGANNDGPLVTLIRDEVLAKGITINGLPIMLNKPNLMNVNVGDLDIYYCYRRTRRIRDPNQRAREGPRGDSQQACAGGRWTQGSTRAYYDGVERCAHFLLIGESPGVAPAKGGRRFPSPSTITRLWFRRGRSTESLACSPINRAAPFLMGPLGRAAGVDV